MFLSLEAPEKWITSVLVIGAGLMSYIRGKKTDTKLQTIELNVDGNLSKALREIEELKNETMELRKTTSILTKLLAEKGKNGKPLATLEP
jgi:hypothetical protein